MNIFVLDHDATLAAQAQCDSHVVKMTLESAQMLSTAHRMLDGISEVGLSKSGKRTVKLWTHPAEELYKAVHFHHPCTVWTMKTSANYRWHWCALATEYSYRYGRTHSSFSKLYDLLRNCPKNIPQGGLTPFPLAMGSNPECMFPEDPVKSYQLFYQTKQHRFSMKWTRRKTPEWFKFSVDSFIEVV